MGERKKLPLLAGAPYRRSGEGRSSLNSSAWESEELHATAVPRDQGRKQRIEDDRETTVDYYQSHFQNRRPS